MRQILLSLFSVGCKEPSFLKIGRYCLFAGWRLGRNPPSVNECGIRLIGLPALSGRDLISDCLPFPLTGRPFHRSHRAFSARLPVHHRPVQDGRFVSAPVPWLSPCTPSKGALQFYAWAEFPQTLHLGSESHTPTRQPIYRLGFRKQ